jgi:hypothetical protein
MLESLGEIFTVREDFSKLEENYKKQLEYAKKSTDS